MSNVSNYLDLHSDKETKSIQSKDNFFQVSLYSNAMDLSVGNNFSKFVKNIEGLIRRSEEYKRYIHYLINDVGLTKCMVLSNIDMNSHDSITIEMHHGPILTLYDIISIIIEHSINTGERFNSLLIAKRVLDEHYLNNIQVIMLSKTVHELVHDNKIFIHPEQAWGNLNEFLTKYKEGIIPEMKDRINNYLELAKKYRANDFGILETGHYKNYGIIYKQLKDHNKLNILIEGRDKDQLIHSGNDE